MKKQTVLFFYLLAIYVVLQFAWWGFHLIELTEANKQAPTLVHKRIIMITSEGAVFFTILILGLWKIRASIKKELQLSQRQTNFLLSVTHELKTPLSANKLYLQTLHKHHFDEEKQKDLMEKAIQENERLESMIDNILNASRLENNALKAIKSPLNLSELVHNIVQRTHKRQQQSFIKSNILPQIEVLADRFFIETIINNLIDNAIKYAGINANIQVNLYQERQHVVLQVKDNGAGISPQTQREMFKKFFRAGDEETRAQKGSGLGLYIVSELARIHGLKIRFSTNTPTGAIFELIL